MSEQISMTEAARRLGLSISGMSRLAERTGLALTPGRGYRGQRAQYLDWEELQAMDPATRGYLLLTALAKEIGVTVTTLKNRAAKAGIHLVRSQMHRPLLFVSPEDADRLRALPQGNVLHADRDGIRVCSVCHQEKPLEQYFRQKGRRVAHCKKCHNGYVASWKSRNIELSRSIQKRAKAKYEEKRKAARA